MKKAVLSTMALVSLTAGAVAADLRPRATPAVSVTAVPVFSWTGFYVGLNGGYAFNEDGQRGRFVTPNGTGGTFTVRPASGASSFTGNSDSGGDATWGGQVGYNMQFGMFVAGLEADLQTLVIGGNEFSGQTRAASPRGPQPDGTFGISAPAVGSTGNVAFFNLPQQLDFFGTVRGRLGVAYDRVMVYATGGLAWTALDDENRNIPSATFFTTPTARNRAQRIANASRNESQDIGWTVGGGVEYAFTRNLSARIEGLYVSIGEEGGSTVVGVTNRGQAIRQTGGDGAAGEFGLVRGGVNFRFDTF